MKKILIILVFALINSGINAQEKGQFTDTRDGQVYKTVKIGNQIWMAENLAFKPNSSCKVYDNKETNAAKYGRLYSWETAKTVCPDGWHLPSKDEWKILDTYLGKIDTGKKMKSITGWELYKKTNYGNNKSGFNALAGGYYQFYDKSFVGKGRHGAWWSSTSYDDKNAWFRELMFRSTRLHIRFVEGDNYSVRCIKN